MVLLLGALVCDDVVLGLSVGNCGRIGALQMAALVFSRCVWLVAVGACLAMLGRIVPDYGAAAAIAVLASALPFCLTVALFLKDARSGEEPPRTTDFADDAECLSGAATFPPALGAAYGVILAAGFALLEGASVSLRPWTYLLCSASVACEVGIAAATR